MVVLSQSLTQPERKHNLAIREVAEYIPDAPFTRSRRNSERFRVARVKKIFQPNRRGPSDFERVPACHVRGIGIDGHEL